MSHRTSGPGRCALGVLLALSALCVYAEGIPSRIYGPFFAACGLALLLLLWKRPVGPRIARFTLLIISVGFALALGDLALRKLIADQLYYRPDDRFLCPWPPAPRLVRYEPDAVFRGTTHGDLAAMSGKAELREERHVDFETDPRGFRNTGPLPAEPLDILLVGDSFGVGTGTSQEATWGSLFRDRWGYRTYNLSAPGGPWNELMNLKAELDGLPTREGTVVLWPLFGGNDLDDALPDTLELPELNGPLAQLAVSYRSFRRHSPLRRLIRKFSTSRETVLERALPDGTRFLFLDLYTERTRRSPSDVLEHENYGGVERVFAEMRRYATEKRLTVAVVYLPAKAEVYSPVLDGTILQDSARQGGELWKRERATSGFATALERLSSEQGFPFLDLTPHLVAAAGARFSRGDLLWWRDDSHWSEVGHRVAAEVVVEHLVRGILGRSGGQ